MGSPRAPFYLRPRRSWRTPGELLNFSLFFTCAVLLVLSRIEHGLVVDFRDRLVDVTAPVLELASIPAIKARHAVDRAKSYAGLFNELERLKAENEQLKNQRGRSVSLKVSEKGGVSVYGLGRFPVTLYKEQWVKLLGMADEIRSFITENDSKLKAKPE
jgi:hypothetical protein